jgi:hypothetical protein
MTSFDTPNEEGMNIAAFIGKDAHATITRSDGGGHARHPMGHIQCGLGQMRKHKGTLRRSWQQSLCLKKWPFPVKQLVHELSVPRKWHAPH